MENVQFYNGTGKTIELALIKAGPNQVTKIQKDQVTPQTLQAYGESIAIANMDGLAIHVGMNINSQYLIRQFGWEVGGVEPYKAPSRANKLQEKQDGFDAAIVAGAVQAEKDLDEAVTDTGTSRARVERLDKDSAKRGALNVVTAAVGADKAEGTGAEPPKMPEEDQGPPAPADPEPQASTEPETPQEPSQDAGPTSETQEGGEASEGGEEAGSAATEEPPPADPEPKSKPKAKKGGKGKKKGGKKKKSS